MRKVFIDGGAHIGESVDCFFDTFEDAKDYEYFAFEPNPACQKKLIEKQLERGINLEEKALWIHNEGVKFYIGRYEGGEGEGSTIMLRKVSGKVDYNNPLEVKSIDLSQWLYENVRNDDYCVLKLDIEGAEYAVLSHLMITGAIKLIDRLMGEFHSVAPTGRIRSVTKETQQEVIEGLKKYNLHMEDWYNNKN